MENYNGVRIDTQKVSSEELNCVWQKSHRVPPKTDLSGNDDYKKKHQLLLEKLYKHKHSS